MLKHLYSGNPAPANLIYINLDASELQLREFFPKPLCGTVKKGLNSSKARELMRDAAQPAMYHTMS